MTKRTHSKEYLLLCKIGNWALSAFVLTVILFTVLDYFTTGKISHEGLLIIFIVYVFERHEGMSKRIESLEEKINELQNK